MPVSTVPSSPAATVAATGHAADAPDVAPESAFRSIIRTFGLLDRVMHPYFSRFGISGAQWGVLRTLHRAELDGIAALRVTELGKRLIIRPPSVTSVVDRLERDGLVSREPAADDRRVKLVSLTAKGRNLVTQVLEVHEPQIQRILAGLSRQEQGELSRLLARLHLHLERLADSAGDGVRGNDRAIDD
jgi:DNA-binding MarR family transcriptional regulator